MHKALAAAGVASRRSCEALIAAGRVSVNGQIVTTPGVKVNPRTDVVTVDGARIALDAPPKPVYIMLNKPVGYVCTLSDPHAPRTVLQLVSQVEARVYPVGRLDADSSGLLLLTNDGDFAHRMTHPRYHVPRTYRVRVKGFLTADRARRLAEGIDLEDGRTAPAQLRFLRYDAGSDTTELDITLYEGRNRQVRRMMEAVGHPVRTLERIAFGCLRLKGLNPGTWRKLRPDEVQRLLDLARPVPTPPKQERRSAPSRPPARGARTGGKRSGT
ncbi:MAG: rRNA pseudouridine synthase [Chthonomonadaceae bacterium]|nr:rRNA pseudouridine synthase [Chthonomonadaceae bacterium]